jgi:ribosomal protein S18 acetylase RimI-like enzyme
MARPAERVRIAMSAPRDKDMDVTRNTLAPDVTLHHLVRRSSDADLAPMADVLAAAFHDDPVVSWLLPDAGRRRADLPAMMRMFAARFQPHGENCVNETVTGAALWLPPGATFTAEEDARFETAFVAAAGQDIDRIGELMAVMEAAHPTDPHHYLMLLGVVPDHQGAGIGSALLRAVLDIADAAGEPAYLEAASSRNRALYERHGFEVTRELRCGDSPPLWAMWRDPV